MTSLLPISGPYLFYQLSHDIINLSKSSETFDKNKITQKIASFLKSDDFIIFFQSFGEKYIIPIIKLCETCEKSLFLKIFFPLLEELKKANFDNKLKQAKKSKNNKEDILNSFNEENQNKIDEVLKLSDEDISESKISNNLNKSIISQYANIFEGSLKIIFGPCNEKNEKHVNFQNLKNIKKYYSGIIKQIFENFNELSSSNDLNSKLFDVDIKSLEYTKDLYQIFNMIIYILKFVNSEKYRKINQNSFSKTDSFYEDTLVNVIMNKKFNENCFWFLLDKNKKTKEYNILILKEKKLENEKLSFNIYEIIEKRKNNNIIMYICQNIFSNEKEIIFEYDLKKNKGDDLNAINKIINEEINQTIDELYRPYILIENNIITYQQMNSYCLQRN